jgi:hypothetical protein
MQKLDIHAGWIWRETNTTKNDLVVFRKTFNCGNLPETAPAYIAAETKYWLCLNGKEVVFEGGLFRESKPGSGWADEVDLAPYLQQGQNTMEALVWFYGNGGRNNYNSKQAGFLFVCEALGLCSGSDFLVARHPAYSEAQAKFAHLYGGHSLRFDANIALEDSAFSSATVYENQVWGDCYLRPIPLHRHLPAVPAALKDGTAKLPYAMWFTVELEVNAKGGEVLWLRSDRFEVNGGPYDRNVYSSQSLEFVCKPGRNRFASFVPLNGEAILVSVPESAEITSLAYRESGYDCDIVGEFNSNNALLNTLVKKSARTLYLCMRDNFMDCPDRERGQWIGDICVQIPQVMFLLDDRAKQLVRKAIFDFINLRRGDELVGLVPGQHKSELPAQSLNAIGELGFIAQYVKYTGDTSVLQTCFLPIIRYLQLFEMSEDGLIALRSGNWGWMDHLHNIDKRPILNAWYYSALKYARVLADTLQTHEFDAFLETRIDSIYKNYSALYWHDNLGYSSNPILLDDRANALAVLVGLCPAEHYPVIRDVLLSVFSSTIYMENYILSALCEMGYKADALRRMLSRYYNLAVNENTTLWEDFFLLGTKNHAWSGAPATIAFKYFAGIDTDDGFRTVRIQPDLELLPGMSFTCSTRGGTIHWDENAVVNRSQSTIQP